MIYCKCPKCLDHWEQYEPHYITGPGSSCENPYYIMCTDCQEIKNKKKIKKEQSESNLLEVLESIEKALIENNKLLEQVLGKWVSNSQKLN